MTSGRRVIFVVEVSAGVSRLGCRTTLSAVNDLVVFGKGKNGVQHMWERSDE